VLEPGVGAVYPAHLFEKLAMLARGELSRPSDWFDLVLHATPWLLLTAKGIVSFTRS